MKTETKYTRAKEMVTSGATVKEALKKYGLSYNQYQYWRGKKSPQAKKSNGKKSHAKKSYTTSAQNDLIQAINTLKNIDQKTLDLIQFVNQYFNK